MYLYNNYCGWGKTEQNLAREGHMGICRLDDCCNRHWCRRFNLLVIYYTWDMYGEHKQYEFSRENNFTC